MDEARVQPVPWVWVVLTSCEVRSSQSPVAPQHRTSVATPASSAFRWPPLTSAQAGPMSQRSRAACRMASTVSIFRPPKRSSASGRLGVMIVAMGKSSDFTLAIASSCRSTWPLVETITGSRTTRLRHCSTGPARSRRPRATPATVSLVASIPVLTTSAPMSSSTDLICCCTKSTGTGKMPWTPCVFCAVSAAMAVMPNAPMAAQLLRSACMPAPPPLSEPATMSTRGGVILAARIRGAPTSAAIFSPSAAGGCTAQAANSRSASSSCRACTNGPSTATRNRVVAVSAASGGAAARALASRRASASSARAPLAQDAAQSESSPQTPAAARLTLSQWRRRMWGTTAAHARARSSSGQAPGGASFSRVSRSPSPDAASPSACGPPGTASRPAASSSRPAASSAIPAPRARSAAERQPPHSTARRCAPRARQAAGPGPAPRSAGLRRQLRARRRDLGNDHRPAEGARSLADSIGSTWYA
mmetsp:Transcript_78895/g.243447  ORF Transcript_78895/g.243447 Transcript_78895/m.243447 type:complete len:476 (+) Transcript_78895:224-1651(+)